MTTCSLNGNESPYLRQLKVMLNELVSKKEDNTVEYVGSTTGKALYKDKNIAVQLAWMPKGSVFPSHQHKVHEWLIIIDGKLEMFVNGERSEIATRQEIHLNPEDDHSIMALEDTYMIGITIPAEEGYPDA